MIPQDFDWYDITNFTAKEVMDTGADLFTVKLEGMLALQRFRVDERINRPVLLLPGGITSGSHRAPEHMRGEAFDVTFQFGDTPNVTDVVNAAHQAGFRGVGVYHNCLAYSFHLDIGKRFRSWAAFKRHGDQAWTYISQFADPAERATR